MAARAFEEPVWHVKPSRREQILAAARDLFESHGYEAVTVDQIGAAAGVTGPAIYRHFKKKSDVLLALLGRIVEHLNVAAADIVRDLDPETALLRLIDSHVSVALDDGALLTIYIRERQMLPADEMHALRQLQHEFLSSWDEIVQSLRPDLSKEEVVVAVRLVTEMIGSSVWYTRLLDRQRFASVVRTMAWQALVPGRPLPVTNFQEHREIGSFYDSRQRSHR